VNQEPAALLGPPESAAACVVYVTLSLMDTLLASLRFHSWNQAAVTKFKVYELLAPA